MRRQGRAIAGVTVVLGLTVGARAQEGQEAWSRFRGPNGSGLSVGAGLPLEFGPDKNLRWKTDLPPGHSSPVLAGDRIFLTGFRDEKLLTLCLSQREGKLLWQREVSRERSEPRDKRNNSASPTPVSDGEAVYVFFPEFGLLAYDLEGRERWRLPLGPFNNVYGMGASPILALDQVVLVCDQSTGSFILAVGKHDGRLRWKTERPEATSGHSTPVLYQPGDGSLQVVVPGSFFLTAYDAKTGEKIWWVGGLSFEMKSTPVVAEGVFYIPGFGFPENQPGSQLAVPAFAEALKGEDRDGDGRLQKSELADERTRSRFHFMDLDGNGALEASEWAYYRAAMASENGLLAIRGGGRGDQSDSGVLWRYHKAVPQLPSPLLFQGVLYMVNDGGIVTSLDPASGKVIEQGRLQGAIDRYYASPVAADGKIFMVSETGKVAVLKPGGSLGVLVVNDLGELCYATPALAQGRIYIRTLGALYCFGT
jgi:outer membrane protein assembly factor BamB